MLAYRHAFHAGNHADVLKHIVLVQVLQYLNEKEKGWRFLDTHAGAGGYSLEGGYAQQNREFEQGVGCLMQNLAGTGAGAKVSQSATSTSTTPRTDVPAAVADYTRLVQQFNGSPSKSSKLRQYPGSPALARLLMRPQDQLRLVEMHPTEYKILHSYVGQDNGVQTQLADGYESLKTHLPPITRRGLTLIDPPYEIKTDYTRALGALRECLTRFPEGMVMVWLPQVQLLPAAQLPQRLKAAGDTLAKKGWVHAKLTVAQADARGFGMVGSNVFIANPPHNLYATLQTLMPWLAHELAQFDGAKGFVERSAKS
jgi:23S rRNA (adenine2030-N6)-methyltransferase